MITEALAKVTQQFLRLRIHIKDMQFSIVSSKKIPIPLTGSF